MVLTFPIKPSVSGKLVRRRIRKDGDNGSQAPTELEKDATIMHLQTQVASLTAEVMKWKERHGRVEARESATIEFVQAQMEEQYRKANALIENSQRRFETKEKRLQLEHAKETALIKQQTVAEQAQQHQIVLDCLLIKHSKEVDLLKEEISTQKAVCN
jgi:hypothetical protein